MQHILKKFPCIPFFEYFPDEYVDTVEAWHCPVRSQVGVSNPGWSPLKQDNFFGVPSVTVSPRPCRGVIPT
jgi:hypothetical protein